MSSIGPHLVINGEISCDDDLTIEGSVTGVVFVRGATLTIEEGARVEADVRAAEVVVSGEVHGGIAASQRIELTPSSSVEGSLSASRIAISDGARFTGRVDMGRRTIAALVAGYRASRPPEDREPGEVEALTRAEVRGPKPDPRSGSEGST